jgi:uncharacterized protein (TIGR00730 family)
MAAARAMAEAFHKNNITLVYGGGTVGMMGELARTLVKLSGPDSVHGVIPAPLVKLEQALDSDVEGSEGQKAGPDPKRYGKATVVPDMHTRKSLMAKEVIAGGPGSGFVALPGGYGTLEELMEVMCTIPHFLKNSHRGSADSSQVTTWNQLGIHDRGVVLYNVEGYYDGLMSWIKTAVSNGFVQKTNENIIAEAKDADSVISTLRDYKVSHGRFDLEWGKQ